MEIISLDKKAASGTNIIVWYCPYKKDEKRFLYGVETQNRTTLSFLNLYLDVTNDPVTESGSAKAIILKKACTGHLTDSLHWEGKMPIYSPMKVCAGYFNCSASDELNMRVLIGE